MVRTRRISAIIISFGLFLLALSGVGYWKLHLSKSYAFKGPEEWLAPLTAQQLHCVEQVTSKENINYVELQDNDKLIELGFSTSEGIYAALLLINQDQSCQVEFQDKISGLQDVFEHRYTPEFRSIQRVELTDDQNPEIFIWLERHGAPRLDNTLFLFYSKRDDGSYTIIYQEFACQGWSSLEFIETDNEDRPKILTVDDVRCNEMRRGKLGTSHTEFFLTNDGREIIRAWNEGLD